MKKKINKSKHLAYLLRHDKDYNFDENGWRDVSDLVKNHGYTRSELAEIVSTDNKGRYEFSEDKTRIRARQGHSIKVDVELEIKTPPPILYHGTAKRFLDSIKNSGIQKMSRLYVQLSEDKKTAQAVGSRHGEPAILVIDTEKMSEDGVIFRLSRNNVWLVDEVNPKYIKWDETIFSTFL